MKIRSHISIFVVLLFTFTGCAITGPHPTSPSNYMSLSVDSIPSGADLYGVSKDGTLTEHMGTTPHDIRIGYALQAVSPDGLTQGYLIHWWCPKESCWGIPGNSSTTVTIGLAAKLDGYNIKKVEKNVLFLPNIYATTVDASNKSIVIPLNPEHKGGVSKEEQQQQQQQQQTVIMPDSGSSVKGEPSLVMITSTPEDAEIYIDGAFVGNAPANLKLSEGIHIIEVKKGGFKPYRKELRVFESSELSLRVTLEEE